MSQTPIHILGAGLTGMSAAHHLLRDPSLREAFTLHERLEHPGGHAITLEDDGFRFDRTGHLLHLRDDAIRNWIVELVGQDDLVNVQRRSLVFSHGRYTRYPYQANTFGLPPQVAYECLMGFLAARTTQQDRPPPRSFEDYCLQHFGEGFSKHFMIPYNAKLWGVHPREITADWCSRFVPMPQLEDVIAGAVGLNDRELGYNTNFLYPRRGIGALSAALARPLAPHIRFRSQPVEIDWRGRQLLFSEPSGGQRRESYDLLISTAPLDVLVGLLKDPPPAVRDAATKLRCNHLYYLDVALDTPCGVDLHWAYVPEDRYPFYRVGCYSHFSAEMAPPGKAGLYVELATRQTPKLEALLPEVTQGLMDMQLIADPGAIRFARLRRIDHAYVVYDHDYYDSVAAIVPFLEQHRISTTGRYGGWNYSSMEDALIFGREAAERAVNILKR